MLFDVQRDICYTAVGDSDSASLVRRTPILTTAAMLEAIIATINAARRPFTEATSISDNGLELNALRAQ